MQRKLSMLLLGLALASGCASLRTAQVGSQRVVEKIPSSTPDWRAKSFWEKDGSFFYEGGVTGRADMALGLREARGEAEKKLAEQVRAKIRTEFGSAAEGQNLDGQTGSYVKDLIAKVSENVEVSGTKQTETYVEKIEETTGFGVKYSWNCYTLLSLEKPDYLEARRRAMDGALAEARRAQNTKAEESLKKAFDKLQGDQTATAGNPK